MTATLTTTMGAKQIAQDLSLVSAAQEDPQYHLSHVQRFVETALRP